MPAIFMLKARFGYRDGREAEGDGRPTINVNIPAALPAERYIEAIRPEALSAPKPEEEKE